MRYSKMEKLVKDLTGGGETVVAPAASHTISVADVLLTPASRVAPVNVGPPMDVPEGLYRLMFIAEFDAPDQGDGVPPALFLNLNGIDIYMQGLIEPIQLFQGNVGPTQILNSDQAFTRGDGVLQVKAYIESSAVAGADSAVSVTLDKLVVSLLG